MGFNRARSEPIGPQEAGQESKERVRRRPGHDTMRPHGLVAEPGQVKWEMSDNHAGQIMARPKSTHFRAQADRFGFRRSVGVDRSLRRRLLGPLSSPTHPVNAVALP